MSRAFSCSFLFIWFIVKSQSVYETNLKATIGVLMFSSACGSIALYQHQKLKNVPKDLFLNDTNSQVIPFFDKYATVQYNSTAKKLSDYSLLFSLTMPLLFFVSNNKDLQNSTYSSMILENIILTFSLTSLSKTSLKRFRPYVFNPITPLELKQKPNARYSFFSGHTSLSFCSATLFTLTYFRLYPEKNQKFYYGILSFTLASSTGLLRYFAGKHYPSDIITGAIVGITCGTIINQLHSRK